MPLDDSDAFNTWHQEKGLFYKFNGHHPWTVRASGFIFLSIHLFPEQNTATGLWYFVLSGDAYSSSQEIVKWFLAMKKAEIPVVLADVERIAGRFFETDNIGIVPDNENVQFTITFRLCLLV